MRVGARRQQAEQHRRRQGGPQQRAHGWLLCRLLLESALAAPACSQQQVGPAGSQAEWGAGESVSRRRSSSSAGLPAMHTVTVMLCGVLQAACRLGAGAHTRGSLWRRSRAPGCSSAFKDAEWLDESNERHAATVRRCTSRCRLKCSPRRCVRARSCSDSRGSVRLIQRCCLLRSFCCCLGRTLARARLTKARRFQLREMQCR